MNTELYILSFLAGLVYGGNIPNFLLKDGTQVRSNAFTSDSEVMKLLLTDARLFTKRLMVRYYLKGGGEIKARQDFDAVQPRSVNDFTDGSSYGFVGGRGIHFVPADISARRLATITITGLNTLMPRHVIYYYGVLTDTLYGVIP